MAWGTKKAPPPVLLGMMPMKFYVSCVAATLWCTFFTMLYMEFGEKLWKMDAVIRLMNILESKNKKTQKAWKKLYKEKRGKRGWAALRFIVNSPYKTYGYKELREELAQIEGGGLKEKDDEFAKRQSEAENKMTKADKARKLMSNTFGSKSSSKPIGTGYQEPMLPYKCLERKEIAKDVFYFKFEGSVDLPVGGHMHWQGKFVNRNTLRKEAITKPYTPISHPQQVGSHEYVIKLYRKGKITPWICNPKNVEVGKTVNMKRAGGRLKYANNNHKHILMFAAGTGITPMYQVAQHIRDCEEEKTLLHLVYCNRSEDLILMREEVDKMAVDGVWGVTHILSQPSDAWNGLKGRINKQMFLDVLETYNCSAKQSKSSSRPGCSEPDLGIYLCGPGAYCKQIKTWFKELGYKKPYLF